MSPARATLGHDAAKESADGSHGVHQRNPVTPAEGVHASPERVERAGSGRPGLSTRSVLRLQATAGNCAVTAMLHRARTRPRPPTLPSVRSSAPPIRAPATRDAKASGASTAPIGGASVTDGAVPETELAGRPFDLLQRQVSIDYPQPPP